MFSYQLLGEISGSVVRQLANNCVRLLSDAEQVACCELKTCDESKPGESNNELGP